MSDQQRQLTITDFRGALSKRQDTMWLSKPAYLKMEKAAYFSRAIMEISQSEQLRGFLSHTNGQTAILVCIQKALQLGLAFGGSIPQCYLVPFKGKPQLIITYAGYRNIALSDPPVIVDCNIQLVYSRDKWQLDLANGIIKMHEVGSETVMENGSRGEIQGGYWRVLGVNGIVTAGYMSIADIISIRDNTPAYKNGGSSDAWEKNFSMMCEKTIGKRALKPYALFKESLAIAMEVEESGAGYEYDEQPEQSEPIDRTPPKKDIADRVAVDLENKTKRQAPIPTQKEESVDKQKADDKQPGGANSSLFE